MLNYRTIRYPGHASVMKALLHDLRLKDRRGVLKDILEHALPETIQDVVIVFVTASGLRGGRLTQETYANKIYSGPVGGAMRSAIQLTTASGVAAVLDLLATGKLPQNGFVRQEDAPLDALLRNRFGQVYAIAGEITSKANRRDGGRGHKSRHQFVSARQSREAAPDLSEAQRSLPIEADWRSVRAVSPSARIDGTF